MPVAAPAPLVPPRLSVAEIIAQAADYFRLHHTDPDAWAKGFVALEKLRPEEIEEALRHAESLREEPDVFENMMPFLAGMGANIHPRAALDYSILNLEGNARALAVQRVVGAWAGRNPEETWAWYRQTTDAGSAPIRDDTWGWLPRHIFEGWVRRDASGAFNELAGLELRDERSAVSGISDAMIDAGILPAILDGVTRMADDARRHRMAEELIEEWVQCRTSSGDGMGRQPRV